MDGWETADAAGAGARRAELLAELRILDTPREERFNRIVALAARLIDVPVSLINLVDDHRQWSKAAVGVPGDEVPIAESICAHVVEQGSLMEVPDLAVDPRFVANTFVTADPGLRFYAGAPLLVRGTEVGTLCVADHVPRRLTDDQREVLAELAAWATAEVANTALNELVAELADRERRLDLMLRHLPEAVLLLGGDGTATPANPAAVTAFGGGQTRALRELFPDADPDVWVAPRGSDAPREVTGRRADGTAFPAEVTVAHVAASPAATSLLLVRDLTRGRAEELEQRRRQRLTELVLDATHDAVLVLDPAGRVLLANPAAGRLLGVAASDLVGHPVRDVVRRLGPDGAEDVTGRGQAYVPPVGPPVPFSVTLLRQDGTTVPVEGTVAALTVAEPRATETTETGHAGVAVLGAVVSVRDVTVTREVERLKDQLLSVVSHELRTPLTSIKGSLALLAAGVVGELSDEQRPLLTMAVSNADRLARLVDDILDLERLDAGRLPLAPRLTDPAAVARTALDTVAGAAEAAGVSLLLDCPSPVPAVHVDPDRLAQALVNLVANAVKFSPPGAPVVVHVAAGDGAVSLAVRDHGRGIPAEHLEKVFDRFHQVESGDARAARGTGLGLSITRSIVERSGGRVEVASTPGDGSTFTVTLPAAAGDESAEGGR